MGLALTVAPAPTIGRVPTALWRRSVGATYVLGPNGVVVLGGPAALVWELLDEPVTVATIVEVLAELHGIGAGIVEPEVRSVLDDLTASGLVLAGDAAVPVVTSAAVAHRRAGSAVEPGLDPAAAIAGWDLVDCPLALPDPTVAGWPALVESIRRERLSGLAVAAHRAGDLALGDDDLEPLRSAHGDAMITSLRLEQLLLDTLDRLADAGVAPLVIKGPAIAHLRYADPSMRPFGDIDLLVPAHQLDTAFAVLTDAGHRRRYPTPRPGFDQRFGKGAAFVAADGLEIDVHRTFAAGPFGLTVDADEAHAGAVAFSLGGRTVHTLGDAATLVSLAMHAVLGTRVPRLLNLRDVAQVAGQVDVDDAVVLATRWHVDATLALAIRHAVERFSLPPTAPLAAWASSHRADGRQRRALHAYTSPRRSYARQAIAALPALPGTRARAAYLRAMVLPDRSYVAGPDGGQLRRWLRLARLRSRVDR